MTTENINQTCTKESAKLTLRNATQFIRNFLMRKKARMIQNYLQNSGVYQIRNTTHGYPGV